MENKKFEPSEEQKEQWNRWLNSLPNLFVLEEIKKRLIGEWPKDIKEK